MLQQATLFTLTQNPNVIDNTVDPDICPTCVVFLEVGSVFRQI